MKDASWPAATTESLRWTPSNPEMVPRRRRAEAAEPYSATVPAMIADRPDVPLSGRQAADVAEAEAAIARFDERVGSELVGFAVIALRTEAATSSQIERLTASAASIAVAEHSPRPAGPIESNAHLIAANVSTLVEAMTESGPFDEDDIIEIQRDLLTDSAPSLTGSFRREQVWVGGHSYSPHGARHIAPHHERVPAAITDFVRFANRPDLGGLAPIAVAHAQFETIHPFADGNGRTGRVLVQRMLRNAGLTTRSLLPLSSGLLGATDRYFDALDAYRTGDIEPIVGAFVDAAFAALANASTLADDLAETREQWASKFEARSDSTVWPLLAHCLTRPSVVAPAAAADLGVSLPAVYSAIDRLVDEGVLTQNSKARRNRVWLVPEVVDAVERFMERSLRPG